MKKRGLGRSLNAILSPTAVEKETLPTASTPLRQVPTEQLSRGKYQPRREMDDAALEELALSIQAQGILQPIIVRELSFDRYEIIAGERRWRAAQKIALKEVPVIIKDLSDEAAMAIGLIENIQRENLNAIDEAFGLQRLLNEFSLTHQEIAQAIGRSRTAVSNLLRLLNLPETIQKYLQQGDLEMGHARALLSLPEAQQIDAANYIIAKKLSVRDAERYVKKQQYLTEATTPSPITTQPTHALKQWQKQLSQALNTKVTIQQNAQGKGKFIISFDSQESLQHLYQRFMAK